jgi:hypothetical protein
VDQPAEALLARSALCGRRGRDDDQLRRHQELHGVAVRLKDQGASLDYEKPVLLPETNTAYVGRVTWLRQLRVMLRSMPFIRAMVWSQLPSRGVANLKGRGVGRLDWDVQRDPRATAVLRAIARDGSS